MMLEMFMNELSLIPPAADVIEGQDRVKQFVLTMRAAITEGIRPILHVPQDYYAKPIAPRYYWQDWRNDKRVDYDLRLFYKSLVTKSPFLCDDTVPRDAFTVTDCYWQNNLALGMKAAYIANGLAVSINSSSDWASHLIDCLIREIENGEIFEHQEAIHHASLLNHLTLHRQWINHRIQKVISSGKELWPHINEFFPLLMFCSNVEKEINDLPSESLATILNGLFSLNTYCVAWQTGPFDLDSIGCRVSPESQPTLQKFGHQHTFLCPDGQRRLFSFHVKLGSKWRIYFNNELGPGRMLIGHVGGHLPIVTKPK